MYFRTGGPPSITSLHVGPFEYEYPHLAQSTGVSGLHRSTHCAMNSVCGTRADRYAERSPGSRPSILGLPPLWARSKSERRTGMGKPYENDGTLLQSSGGPGRGNGCIPCGFQNVCFCCYCLARQGGGVDSIRSTGRHCGLFLCSTVRGTVSVFCFSKAAITIAAQPVGRSGFRKQDQRRESEPPRLHRA